MIDIVEACHIWSLRLAQAGTHDMYGAANTNQQYRKRMLTNWEQKVPNLLVYQRREEGSSRLTTLSKLQGEGLLRSTMLASVRFVLDSVIIVSGK